jgi:hypothetical protein
MTTLLKVSTVVLVATAVVLMPFVRVEFLGVYPDRIGVFAQLAVALAPIWKALRGRSARSPRFHRAADPGG